MDKVKVLGWSTFLLAVSTAVLGNAYLGERNSSAQVGAYYKERLSSISNQLSEAKEVVESQSSYCKSLSEDPSLGYSRSEFEESQRFFGQVAEAVGALKSFTDNTLSPDSYIQALIKYEHAPSYRVGAICSDGWVSQATGRGACSHHGGVRDWRYGKSEVKPSGTDGLFSISFPAPSELITLRQRYAGKGPIQPEVQAPSPSLEERGQQSNVLEELDSRNLQSRKLPLDQVQIEPSEGFYIGSTEDNVIKLMGTPTARHVYSDETVIRYDLSSVTISGGKVIEYSDTSENLKVLAPGAKKNYAGHFKVGSSISEVVSVMGTPSSYHVYSDEIVIRYELSSVTIKDGKVSEYSDTSSNLRIK